MNIIQNVLANDDKVIDDNRIAFDKIYSDTPDDSGDSDTSSGPPAKIEEEKGIPIPTPPSPGQVARLAALRSEQARLERSIPEQGRQEAYWDAQAERDRANGGLGATASSQAIAANQRKIMAQARLAEVLNEISQLESK